MNPLEIAESIVAKGNCDHLSCSGLSGENKGTKCQFWKTECVIPRCDAKGPHETYAAEMYIKRRINYVQ